MAFDNGQGIQRIGTTEGTIGEAGEHTTTPYGEVTKVTKGDKEKLNE